MGFDLFTPGHILIVVIGALLLFGPKRLPDIGKSLGKGLREFKNGLNSLTDDPPEPAAPVAPPTPPASGPVLAQPAAPAPTPVDIPAPAAAPAPATVDAPSPPAPQA